PFPMPMRVCSVPVRMSMDVIPVAMNVRVHHFVARLGSSAEGLVKPARETSQIQQSQRNQHQSDGEFQRQAQPRRNDNAENDNGPAYYQHRERVPYAPGDANQRRMTNAALAANNGGHSDHMVRISGMSHPQK